MNPLVENNYISEMMCGSNFSYILSDNSIFLSTEYKVLQSQADSCFVKCMKMTYNGKVQLFYLTSKYKALSSLLPSLDADSFMIISTNLIADIIDVKNNGFLSCRNIDISFEHIFVNPNTYKVSLVYLPISKRIYDDNSSFENEIRTGLVKLISGVSTLSSEKTMQLSADLSNGMLSFEDLYSRAKGSKNSSSSTSKKRITNTNIVDINKKGENLRIVAMNAPMRVEIVVTKDEFVIGKKESVVDGAISFNKMISRVHCKINKNGNQYTITDLQSANGTYVNKIKMNPQQPYPIKNGDIIRLANSDFQVVIN